MQRARDSGGETGWRAVGALAAVLCLSCSPVARGGERCKGSLVDESFECAGLNQCVVSSCGRSGCVSFCALPCDRGCPSHCRCEPVGRGFTSTTPVCTNDGLLCF